MINNESIIYFSDLGLIMAETITIDTEELQQLLEWAIQNNEHRTNLYQEIHYILHNYDRS